MITGARPDLSMARLREEAPVRTPDRAGAKAAAEATSGEGDGGHLFALYLNFTCRGRDWEIKE